MVVSRSTTIRPALRAQSLRSGLQNDWASTIVPIAPILILALSVLLPPEFRITIAGQTLYSYRLAGFALAPWLMVRMMKGGYSFAWVDTFIFAGSAWMVASFVGFYGFARGFASGAAIGLDVLLAYMIARVSLRSLMDLRRFLIVLAPIFLFFGLLLVAEAAMHVQLIREIGRAVFSPLGSAEFGTQNAAALFDDTRFGLLRATGPFSHPILAGTFFSSLVALYLGSRLKSWPLFAGLGAGVLSVFSLSSAALLSIFLIVGFYAYDALQRLVSFLNWKLFLIGSALALSIVQLVTNAGIVTIIIRFTLNPMTGYYRLLIWEYGLQSVERHPLFGIGFTPFEALPWMNDSIDAFWLALAIRHGVLTPVFFMAAIAMILFMLSKTITRAKESDKQTYFGLAIMISVMTIAGFTVSFFGAIATWFFLILGAAVSLCAAASLGDQHSPEAALGKR